MIVAHIKFTMALKTEASLTKIVNVKPAAKLVKLFRAAQGVTSSMA